MKQAHNFSMLICRSHHHWSLWDGLYCHYHLGGYPMLQSTFHFGLQVGGDPHSPPVFYGYKTENEPRCRSIII